MVETIRRRAAEVFQQKATAAPARGTPPTANQVKWLRANQNYVRTSHIGHLGTFKQIGTLNSDGTFVPVAPGQPVMDGNGAFGVGVPVVARKRR